MRYIIAIILVACLFFTSSNAIWGRETIGSGSLIAAPALEKKSQVTVVLQQGEFLCEHGEFGLSKPEEKVLVKDYYQELEFNVDVGTFDAGTELVFYLIPDPWPVCSGEKFLSTDPLHSQLLHRGKGEWKLVWEDWNDYDFNDLYFTIKITPVIERFDPKFKLPFTPAMGKIEVSEIPDNRSHNNQFAYDFDLDTDDIVVAAETGTVLYVEDGYPEGKCSFSEWKKANFIVISHGNEGSAYVHLLKDSILVKPGQKVKSGQPIAKVDSSGFACGDHLHFQIINLPCIDFYGNPTWTCDTEFEFSGEGYPPKLELGKFYKSDNFYLEEGRLLPFYQWERLSFWKKKDRAIG